MIWDNFCILEQIAPSPAAHARGFSRMSREKNGGRPKFPKSFYPFQFWPTTQRLYVAVGILLKYLRRKLLQFE